MWEILNSSIKETITVKDVTPSLTTGKEETGSRKRKSKTEEGKRKIVNQEETVRRKKIAWPKATSEEWSRLDTDLSMILKDVGNSPENKARLHPEIIYKFALERFGEVKEEKKKKWMPPRGVEKCTRLRKEIKALNTAYLEAPEEEQPAIKELQKEKLKKLRIQKRTESMKQKMRKKKSNTDKFYKEPFAFARKVLDPEVKGNLESTKEEVEEFLKNAHGDSRRDEELGEVQGLFEFPEPQVEFESFQA